MADTDIDHDSPEFRAVYARLAALLAGGLDAVAEGLKGVRLTPWQALPLGHHLDKIRYELDLLRKAVARLEPGAGAEDAG